VANKSNGVYLCKYHVEHKKCNKGDKININVVDSLVLHEAYLMELVRTKEYTHRKIKEYTEKIQELQEKINVAEKDIDKRKEKIKNKIKKTLSYLTEKELNIHVDRQIKEETPAINKKIVGWKIEIESMENTIKALKQNKSEEKPLQKIVPFLSDPKDVFCAKRYIYKSLLELTDNQRYDMAHRYISIIRVETLSRKPQIKRITISKHIILPPQKMTDNNNNIAWNSVSDSVYYYDTKAINKEKRIYQLTDKKVKVPLKGDEKIIEHGGIKVYFNREKKRHQPIEERVKAYLKWDDYIIEHIAKRTKNKAI
jgi:hypothetical protein